MRGDADLVEGIRQTLWDLDAGEETIDRLLGMAQGARLVLVGEASHGTHDFYALRAALTARLVAEQGFEAVAVEADFPDAARVDRFVRGRSADRSAEAALGGFTRFPAWMWRNADVVDFVRWLRDFNAHHGRDVGFVGIDLYSLHASMEAVLRFLDAHQPHLADEARRRYACFEQFGAEPEAYASAARYALSELCEEDVGAVVALLRRSGPAAALSGDGADAWFEAEQNARVVQGAEAYYRTMFGGDVSGWNLRDTHMADVVGALSRHLQARGRAPKIVVWAHNSHLGDARATEVARLGELNLGQLLRERHGREVFNIGFTSWGGTVTAASHWGAAAERKVVRPALRDSYEALFHAVGVDRFVLPLRQLGEAAGGLREPRLERAIGVIYRPDTERASHYFRCELPAQFDAVIHIDRSTAVVPLEPTSTWDRGEEPETWPSGL
ncbi:MAG: erythromycin esterase family protein [Myxococcales bacterium]